MSQPKVISLPVGPPFQIQITVQHMQDGSTSYQVIGQEGGSQQPIHPLAVRALLLESLAAFAKNEWIAFQQQGLMEADSSLLIKS